jgi:glycosyltransferase involved in cell wall biosynthesis
MRVLVACSANSGNISPFILEQASELEKLGIEISFFPIKGKGIKGYLSNLSKLKQQVHDFNPDLIHAHSGMTALLCGLQRKKKVVSTFHGSDINNSKLKRFTRLAILLTHKHIVVTSEMKEKLGMNDIEVIPCGVNDQIFKPNDQKLAQKKLGWDPSKNYVLFSSAFGNKVKNYPLAAAAIKGLNNSNIQLIELSGRTREEVAQMLNACDVALMTSFSEGSPQFIKEALATGTPIVSTKVGDVDTLINGIEGCFLSNFDSTSIGKKIISAIEFKKSNQFTNGAARIETLKIKGSQVAEKILLVYARVPL